MDPTPEPGPEAPATDHSFAPPAAAASVTPPRATGLGRRLAAAIVAAIVFATAGGVGIGWNLANFIQNHNSVASPIQSVNPAKPGSSGSGNLQTAASKVIPAIVDVNTIVQTVSGTERAAGTGMILDSSGDVLTNNHVVNGSTSIKVAIQGRSGLYNADVLGVDPGDDVAVIHIEGVSNLPAVQITDSANLHIGDSVLAIGNALGLGGTPRVTQGSITALNQTITASENGANSEQLTGMIQSDAEISPGDSGGALVNSSGQVIGMITAGEATSFRTQTSQVAYAIPSSNALTIADQVLRGEAGNGVLIGPVGYLGVGVETLDPETAAQLGLSVSSGALVRSVISGSPAEKAGITAGSVITAVNSTPIRSSTDLGDALHAFKPGDQVQITWIDGGITHTAAVTLVSGPAV